MSINIIKHKSKHTQSGYTLLEMMIVLAFVGLVLGSAFHLYNMYQLRKQNEQASVATRDVREALNNYLKVRAAYPCPASLTAPQGDANYGTPTDCTSTTIPVGTCFGGICIKQGAIQVAGALPRVRVGMLPFRELNLSEEDAYDKYGSRLIYAVTERQADADTFAVGQGGIRILTDNEGDEVSISGPETGFSYVMISPGENRKGGYRVDGTLTTACNGAGRDVINCDLADPDATFIVVPYSTTGDANHFDDQVRFPPGEAVERWRSDDGVDMFTRVDSDGIIINQPSVVSSSDLDYKLNVGGLTRASSDLLADNLCLITSTNTTACFSPRKIGGQIGQPGEGMTCAGNPAGPFMIGIAGGEPICGQGAVVCPPGQRLVGFSATGLICQNAPVPPPTCAAQNVTICGAQGVFAGMEYYSLTPAQIASVTTSLPGSAPIWDNWNDYYYVEGGFDRVERYVCDNSGIWQLDYAWGDCACYNYNDSWNEDCNDSWTNPDWWDGYQTITNSRVCPNPGTSTVDRTNCSCNCDADPNTNDCLWEDTQPCPEGLTGSIRYMDAYVCPGGVGSTEGHWWDGAWGSYTPDQDDANGDIVVNTCQCTGSQTQSRTLACPSGTTGTGIVEQRTSTCTSATSVSWSDWTEVSRNCTCNSSTTVLPPISCGAAYNGQVTRTEVVTCPGPTVTIQEDRSACVLKNFTYQTTGSGTEGSSSTREGQSCNNGDPARRCYRDMGSYNLVYDCLCLPIN